MNMIEHPENFFGRVQELNLIQFALDEHHYALPFERIITTFYSFFWPNQDVDLGAGLQGIPRIDPFMGILCFLGFISALYFYRQRWNLLALSVLFFGIFSNAFAGPFFEPDYFNGHHCTLVLPILCFFLAQGLDRGLRLIGTKPKFFRIIGLSFIGLLLGTSLALNIYDYFFKFGDSREAWNKLGFNHLAHVEAIENFYPKDHVVAEGHILYGLFYSSCYDRVEQFLTGQTVPINKAAPLEMPIRAAVTKDVVLFLSDWEKYDVEKEKVRKFYPRAVFKDYKDKYGALYLTTIEIAKEDIQKLQKEKHLKLDASLL